MLANIALNFLDWHLEQRGYRFVRYADGFRMVQYTGSIRDPRFLERKRVLSLTQPAALKKTPKFILSQF